MTDWLRRIDHARAIAHLYLWPKIGHYLYLANNHISNIDSRTTLESFQFFLNVPVYLMCLCYLFRIRLPFRAVFIGIYAIALFDELQYFVRSLGRTNFGFGDFAFYFYDDFEALVMLAPLYTIAFLYLFASHSLWSNELRNGVHPS